MVRDRYSAVAIVLHWMIAAAIIFQLILGWRGHGLRTTLEGFSLIQLHKSVGVTILALSLARLAWRLTHRPPPEPGALAPWERRLAVATQWGFYLIMIGLPLSGWVVVSTSKITIPTLLYGTIPWPHVPGLAELAAPAKSAWNLVAYGVHKSLAWATWGLLALHVAGALKHQLFSRDVPVLARMAPGAKAGRWLEPRLVAIVLAAGAIVATGLMISPPVPALSPAPAAPPVAAPTPVPVAPAPAASPNVPGQPIRWAVAPGSTLGFATAFSGAPIEGRFQRWSADIVFDPEALDRSSVRVEIEVASADTGDRQRDEVLPSGDWLDAASHPKAVFAARRFRRTGTDRYVAEGELTLRGATEPLSLPFTLKIDGDTARLRGVTSLDRTAFGVGQGEWTSTDQIPAKVTIQVDLTAKRR